MASTETRFDKYGWPIKEPSRASSSFSRPFQELQTSHSKSGRRVGMETSTYEEQRSGNRARSRNYEGRYVDGSGSSHPSQRPPNQFNDEREKARIKGNLDIDGRRQPHDRFHSDERRRMRAPADWHNDRSESFAEPASGTDHHRATRPRAHKARESRPTEEPQLLTQKDVAGAQRHGPLSPPIRPLASHYTLSQREHQTLATAILARDRQGSRKTSVTFLPSFVADHATPRGGSGGTVIEDRSRPVEDEGEHLSRRSKGEIADSALYARRHPVKHYDPRYDDLHDDCLPAPDQIARKPRMRYPPVMSRQPTSPVVPATPPPTSTYGRTKSIQAGLPTVTVAEDHSESPRYTYSKYNRTLRSGEQATSREGFDHIRHREEILETRNLKQKHGEHDREMTKWADSEYNVYKTESSMTADKSDPTARVLPKHSAKPMMQSDPCSGAQAIRERTGYESRGNTPSFTPDPPSNPLTLNVPGQEPNNTRCPPPPVPLKPRRGDGEGAQAQCRSDLDQDENGRLALALALQEEAQAAMAISPDDPAPMYTELPTEDIPPTTMFASNAHLTRQSNEAKTSSNVPNETDATDRMGDMEDEITCPICMSIMVAVHAVAPCGHTMCGACGSEWFRDHDKCPICRTTPTSTSTPMVPLLPMDRLIEVWVRAKGDEWEGKISWEDRKSAWEALRIVMREEEVTRAAMAGATGDTAAVGSASDPIGMGGEDEYRLREESSHPFQPFSSLFSSASNPFGPFTGFGFSLDSSGSGGNVPQTERNDWTTRFDPDDFDHAPVGLEDEWRVPEWGVNPFMDAFGYTSRPPLSPITRPRHFSAPNVGMHHQPMLHPQRHRSTGFRPGGWLDGMMDLVDTFTRHHRQAGTVQGYGGGNSRGGNMAYANDGRVRDLDGLEQGMARLFADLRRG